MQTLTSQPVSAPGQRITITLTYEGVERDVAVFVPSSYEPSTTMPLDVIGTPDAASGRT